MQRKVTNVTSMTESAEEERRARLRQYLITMVIRTVCFILMIWVRGWWLVLPALGAIFLPMIAVMFANHVRTRRQRSVESPNSKAVVIRQEPVSASEWSRSAHGTAKEDR